MNKHVQGSGVRLFFYLLIGIAIISCGKETIISNPEFIGYWSASAGKEDSGHFILDEKDHAELVTYHDRINFKGKARIKNKALYIGAHVLTILEYPEIVTRNKGTIYENTGWEMTLHEPYLFGNGTIRCWKHL